MRGVNVSDEADFSAVEALMHALILLFNHTLGMITTMKKLSAVVAVLFASASLSVLAAEATTPAAKPAADTAKTTTPAAPAKADAAKPADAKADAPKTDEGKKKPKHHKAPKKPKTEGNAAPAPAPAPAAGDTKTDTKTK